MDDFGHAENEEPVADCDCKRCAIAARDSARIDADRWRKIRYLSTREIKTMTAEEKSTWERLVRGGWWTGDLEALLDGMKMPNVEVRGCALAQSQPEGRS